MGDSRFLTVWLGTKFQPFITESFYAIFVDVGQAYLLDNDHGWVGPSGISQLATIDVSIRYEMIIDYMKYVSCNGLMITVGVGRSRVRFQMRWVFLRGI